MDYLHFCGKFFLGNNSLLDENLTGEPMEMTLPSSQADWKFATTIISVRIKAYAKGNAIR